MQISYHLFYLDACNIWTPCWFSLSISFGMTVALISVWDSLQNLWESSCCIQPQAYPLDELSVNWKAWVQVLHSHSFISADFEGLVISPAIPSLPSKIWSSRKDIQVEDQMVFRQPHDIALLWRTYIAIGRNKLVQISLTLDLMSHRDRSLSQGTSHCCCCFRACAETSVFVKLPLLSFSSSPLCIAADFHSSY